MAVKTKVESNGKAKNRIADVIAVSAVSAPEIWTFRIVGVSPLLQNNPENFIGVADAGGLGKKKVYVDAEEAALRLYKDEDGSFCHPSQAFIKSMVKATSGLKWAKISAPGLIKSSVFIVEQFSALLDANGKPATKYGIDRQPCVVGKGPNAARVLRCRPVWNEWQLDIALEADAVFIREDHVREALSLAGRKVGVGDYRPEKGGRFGRFKVL